MILFQYLDHLPQVPTELTQDAAVFDQALIGKQDLAFNYTRWPMREDLLSWIKSNITNETAIAGIQIITGDVAIHRDRRRWALNYLIDTGGSAVTTQWHQIPGVPIIDVLNPETKSRALNATDVRTILQKTVEPSRWHLISTEVLHSVTGVTGRRQAVTIGLNNDEPLSLLHGQH